MSKRVVLDETLVRNVADLARLDLSGEEVAFYQTHLEKILNFVAALEQVESGSAPPSKSNALTPEREDRVVASLDPELAVSNAKKTSGTSFQVPRIIE